MSLEESGRGRLSLLLRNLGPGARSAWVLGGIWEPEQRSGAYLTPLGMREAGEPEWVPRKACLGGIGA